MSELEIAIADSSVFLREAAAAAYIAINAAALRASEGVDSEIEKAVAYRAVTIKGFANISKITEAAELA